MWWGKYTVKVCESKECQDLSHSILRAMDVNTDPCENFYEFACGKFMKEASMDDCPDQPGGSCRLKTMPGSIRDVIITCEAIPNIMILLFHIRPNLLKENVDAQQ